MGFNSGFKGLSEMASCSVRLNHKS